MNLLLRNILEVGVGIVYLIGAVFNSLYTFRHGEEFYGIFARGTWLKPTGQAMRKMVIPQSKMFTGLLVVFQVSAALSILSRGSFVGFGLIAGATFCFIAALVSNTTGAIANFILAGVQLFLLLTR
jgi:hypothetical protein